MTLTKPPTVFWIISIIALLWNLMGIGATVGQFMITDEMISRLTPEQQAMYENTPKWTMWVNVVAVVTGLLGAILLLLRKKLAITLFAISLLAVLIHMLFFILFTDNIAANGIANALIMPLLVICIAGFLLYYARKSNAHNWIA